MYEFGEGVEQSFEMAYENFIYAARQGNLESQIKVAEMYKVGIGTDQDLEKSSYWLKKIEVSKAK
jgi:TPR repeat protein